MANEETIPEKNELELDGQSAETQGQGNEAPPIIEDWASAFAELEKKGDKDSGTVTETGADGINGTDGADKSDDESAASSSDQSTDATGNLSLGADADGGSLSLSGGDGATDFSGDTEAEINERVTQYASEIEETAIAETGRLFAEKRDEQGRLVIRQTNGQLGATLNDADIYRKDDDGVPTFFNPDTGRPFTGDNPRRQAQDWVDLYNAELSKTFNQVAEQYQSTLEESAKPVIELLKFTPTYNKLDPVRKNMLDGIIEDYEVFDENGDHIGYSCDLNKALSQVNRQVALIQSTRKSSEGVSQAQQGSGTASVEDSAPSGPALDMKTGSSNGAAGKRPDFKSDAEAMEWLQNQQLEKLKAKGRR